MSLLTKAKSLKPKFSKQYFFSKDEIELAIACAIGDICLTQAAHALGHGRRLVNTYRFLARALAQYVREQKSKS